MRVGRFLMRSAAVAIAMFILGFVGHQLLLGHDYVSIEPIMRSKADMQAHMPFALLNCLCFSIAFVWMYSQVRRAGPWLWQGIRFGLTIWVLTFVPLYLTNYTIQPWPGIFIAKILTWELLAAAVLGIMTGALARGDAVAEGEADHAVLLSGSQVVYAASQGRKA